jgi:hypothetical protein
LFTFSILNASPSLAKNPKDTAAVSLSIDLTIPKEINFEISWNDKITVSGEYLLKTKNLNATATLTNIDLIDFIPYIPENQNFIIKSGRIKKGQLRLTPGRNYLLDGNLEIDNLSLNYMANQIPLDKFKKHLDFKGNLTLFPQLTFAKPLNKESITNASYFIKGNLRQGKLTNAPLIDSLFKIAADFTLDNKNFNLDTLDAEFPQQTTKSNRLRAKGEFDFQNLDLLFDAQTSLPLEQFIHTASKIKELPFEYSGTGDINLKCLFKGNTKQKEFSYHLDYAITEGEYKDFTNIETKGFLTKEKLIVEESRLIYKNIPFQIAGKLKSFTSPKIELNIASDTINIEAKATYDKENIIIDPLFLKSGETQVFSEANIKLKETPLLKIEGYGDIDSNDIEKILNTFNLKYPLLTKLNPQGKLNTKFVIEGGTNINEWEIKLAADSPEMKVYDIEGNQISIELYKDKDTLLLSPLTAEVAEGEIDLRAKLDRLNDKAVLNLVITSIKLENIRRQLNLKQKDLTGKLSCEIYLANNSLSKLDKMDGEGKILIREGNIWQIGLFKGLGEILSIPDFEQITFEEGYSDLIFKDKNILFENIALNSYQLSLGGGGSISLDGDIDFKLFPEINPNLISASEGLQKILSEFIGKAALSIKITGTVKKPKYKIQSIATSPLKGIQDIFEGILKEF